MTNPPIKKSTQQTYKKTNLRLPPELHEAIHKAAKLAGHSANSEIIARLQQDNSSAVLAELAELKQMLRKVLDEI
ncbi:Arc family DNA-binding protein [Duganella sp. CT11-25]|uniref:Arc family DNA-binding protein n=1 Tax=unclassified Duganella TaxID=2636909 RepID=UPI0039B03CBB